jgi:hypothetical protein
MALIYKIIKINSITDNNVSLAITDFYVYFILYNHPSLQHTQQI